MVNKKALKGLFCVLVVLGIGIITLGILMPIYIQKQIDNALDNLWMQKDSANTWDEVPGKYGIKVVRSFALFNVTNPDEILRGETPIVVELPPFPTQEYSKWLDWSYIDKNLTRTTVLII